MRGDGPHAYALGQTGTAAPPHARGWSRRPDLREQLRAGSPACAGMVPSTRAARRRCLRLPRMRGDGPCRALLRLFRPMAPPHARGWSLDPGLRHHRGDGSPACAGMVPRRQGGLMKYPRLPRMRGDGPACGHAVQFEAGAPPHARGWSHGPSIGRADVEGSPACAGIVPSPSGSSGRHRGLPRMRGDGPGTCGGSATGGAAPPHARGWSPVPLPLVGQVEGSPACAGMVPCPRSYPLAWRRLPRMRGDGPTSGPCAAA